MHKVIAGLIGAAAVVATAFAYVMRPPDPRPVTFPDGKRFAFSIVDDTDMATVERDRPLYDILHRYGLRTTKTIWVMPTTTRHAPDQGESLHDPPYRDFIVELRQKGFEIALHGVRGGSSERADIVAGLDEFHARFGQYPDMHVNHSMNADNVYWGADRWSFGPYRWTYGLVGKNRFSGEDPQSVHFWGDLLQQRIRYVNSFTFKDINLLNVTPTMPYHLADKPLVNFWFLTSNGDDIEKFEELLSTDNLDRLELEGGVCLVYAHLGAGSFSRAEHTLARFEARIRDLAERNGWFAPASEILDHLSRQPGWRAEPTLREKIRLETLFLWERITR